MQTAALLVRGEAPAGRFHLQLTASTSPLGSDELLFKLIPDIEEVDKHITAPDPDWIPMTIRGIGEMTGDRTTPVPDPARSWIDLSPFERDEYGVPRAYVHLVASPSDIATWAAMDAAALNLAQAVAGSADRIQYFWDGIWMGEDPASSVTDPAGRFHHVANAYTCDQSLFPTVARRIRC